MQFRTASGVLAHINTNWLTPFKARTIHIATRDKYLMADLLTLQVTECFGFQADGSYSLRICRSAMPSRCAQSSWPSSKPFAAAGFPP